MGRGISRGDDFYRSLKWILLWMGLALICNIGVLVFMGKELALEFFGCYLIELSLSVDNLFVFMGIFISFGIRNKGQHRVLAYGIIGAIILRFLFIMLGARIIGRFEWVLYILGGILIIGGIRMVLEKGGHDGVGKGWIIRVMGRFMPIAHDYTGDNFIVKRKGRWMATPLLAAVFVVELSDIAFAIDSVPAAFSISTHPFIIYVSNIFAVLGLRQMYFVLEHLHERFKYIKYGVGGILFFTGTKLGMLYFDVDISTRFSIMFILTTIILTMILSVHSGRNIRAIGRKF
ncbi:MAG: TerC/Alx family metal homeostasis membrane protein [Anaerovoracaceae bacterium]|jgi:tellurite resistance protein TerC